MIKFAKNFSLSTNFKIGRCASSITKALALNKFAHFKRVLEFQAHIKSLNQIIIFFSHILCFKLFTKRLGKILLQFIITMKKQNFLILEKAINFLKIVWNVSTKICSIILIKNLYKTYNLTSFFYVIVSKMS